MDNSFSLEHILKRSLSLKNLTFTTFFSIFFFLSLTILTGIFYLCLSFLSSHYLLPLKLSSIFLIRYNLEATIIFSLIFAIYFFLIFLIHSISQSFFLSFAQADFENTTLNPKKILKQTLHKSKYTLSTNFLWLSVILFFIFISYLLYTAATTETQFLTQSFFYLSVFVILFFFLYLLPFFLVSFYQNFHEEKHSHIKKIYSLIKTDFYSSLSFSLFVLGAIIIFSLLFLFLSAITTTSFLSLDKITFQKTDFFFLFISLVSHIIKLFSILFIVIFTAWFYSFFSYSSILLYHKRKYDSYTKSQKERTKRIIHKIKLS